MVRLINDEQEGLCHRGPSSVLSLWSAPSTGGPPTLAGGLVQSPVGSLLLSSETWLMKSFVSPSKTGVSVSPSPMEVVL